MRSCLDLGRCLGLGCLSIGAALALTACLGLGGLPWGIGSVPWPWLLAMTGRASVGPRNRPHVTRVPRGLHVATMDHVGMLVALDAKHYVGLGPLAPFANIPSEHHHSTPTQIAAPVCALPCPLDKPWPLGGIDIDKECYLVDLVSRVSLLLIILCERFINPM